MEKIFGLYKNSFVDEEGQMTDEVLITKSSDINEIYWFKGKYNYCDEDYSIYEIEEENGEYQQIVDTYDLYN